MLWLGYKPQLRLACRGLEGLSQLSQHSGHVLETHHHFVQLHLFTMNMAVEV